jgi:tetraacyldisaccharide 4'-kinase
VVFSAESYHALIRGERRGVAVTLARAGLRLVSLPYGLGVRVRNTLFDIGWKKSHRATVPVVSVGNLTLGGTGKTPCVEYLAALCRDRLNRRPAILSRGYGSEAGRNDEAMVLEENLPDVPHLQGRDRVDLARTAVEELDAEMLILDDGFQHRRLKRDLDIVLLDATRPIRDESMFPRGLLREPRSSLKRADFAILTRCDQSRNVDSQRDWLRRCHDKLPLATSVHRPLEWQVRGEPQPLESFRSKPVAAFCGLGNPSAFRRTLESLGCQPHEFRTFPDHHNYTRDDVEGLRRWADALPHDAAVLTTQKDWVKIRLGDLAGRPLAALRIGLTLTSGEEALLETLTVRIGALAPTLDD